MDLEVYGPLESLFGKNQPLVPDQPPSKSTNQTFLFLLLALGVVTLAIVGLTQLRTKAKATKNDHPAQ